MDKIGLFKKAKTNMSHKPHNENQPNGPDTPAGTSGTFAEEQETLETAAQSTIAEELKAELDELRQQVAEQKDKYLRLFAEFENYKKRTLKEKIDFLRTAAQDTLSALLPILDDFDRAKKNAENLGRVDIFPEGIQLVYNKLLNTLQARGLQAMESNNQPFDTEFHEAVTEIPAPSADLKGKVIDTIEKGYFLNEKIIRHAKVVVGK